MAVASLGERHDGVERPNHEVAILNLVPKRGLQSLEVPPLCFFL
jgi:hypothetical protein